MYGYIDSNGNKHLLSGQQDIPQYTMEQYTALSVKPDIWVCTNYDSSSEYGIDDTNVKHGNTSVKDMIDVENINVSLEGNYGITSAQCKKAGNVVSLFFNFGTGGTASDLPNAQFTKVATIPENARPSSDQMQVFTYSYFVGNVISASVQLKVEPNGDISVYNYLATGRYSMVLRMVYII